jgi:hypothetical protein
MDGRTDGGMDKQVFDYNHCIVFVWTGVRSYVYCLIQFVTCLEKVQKYLPLLDL